MGQNYCLALSTPTKMKISLALVKIPWRAEIEPLPQSAIPHEN